MGFHKNIKVNVLHITILPVFKHCIYGLVKVYLNWNKQLVIIFMFIPCILIDKYLLFYQHMHKQLV